MSLKERLKAQIRASGPLSVAQYMTACLHDPVDGYYATRPRLGENGDFITAPLVSQMFGELIGLWAVEAWARLGRPALVRLVEVGPGDGTLMADALRAARLVPEFLTAAEVWLVEASPVLAAAQRARLGALNWAGSLAEVPEGAPVIVVANELLDCLPARQFVITGGGWAERMVGLDDEGELALGLRASTEKPFPLDGGRVGMGVTPAVQERMPASRSTPMPLPFERAERSPPLQPLPHQGGEALFEHSLAQEAFAADLAARIVRDTGAALLIDYGRDKAGPGDTLQALKRHQKVHPLACPGEADLTVHADFPAVLAAARAEGATAAILTQAEFLRRLGIHARAAALKTARPDRAETIDRQLARLTATNQMGEMFKAAAIWSPAAAVPPGFEEA